MRCGSLRYVFDARLTNANDNRNGKQAKLLVLCNQWAVAGSTFFFSLFFAFFGAFHVVIGGAKRYAANIRNVYVSILKNDETARVHHIKAVVVSALTAELMYQIRSTKWSIRNKEKSKELNFDNSLFCIINFDRNFSCSVHCSPFVRFGSYALLLLLLLHSRVDHDVFDHLLSSYAICVQAHSRNQQRSVSQCVSAASELHIRVLDPTPHRTSSLLH